MKKKFKLRIIITLISIIIIIAALIGAVVYLFAFQNEDRGGILESAESISLNSNQRYLKAFLSLEVSNLDSNSKIKYYIKRPDNKILDQGVIEENGNLNLDKEYAGYKGVWHIEFENLPQGKTLNYHYTFKEMNSGGKDKSR